MKTLEMAVTKTSTKTQLGLFLNAYELLNTQQLQWPVAIYRFTNTSNAKPQHEERGRLKQLVWGLIRQHKSACRGYGFVIDLDRQHVAIPQTWRLPDQCSIEGYEAVRHQEYVAHADDPRDHALVAGLVREGLKKHFKDNASTALGDLWQDYQWFCQMPKGGSEFHFCRRYGVSLERVDGHLVLQCQLSTATLDGHTFADYYQAGRVQELAELIALKRAQRTNRQNRPVDVRVWCDQSYDFKTGATVLTLTAPDALDAHARLSAGQQRKIQTAACHAFRQDPKDIPGTHLRLILDSQITGSEHRETIIDPGERASAMEAVRSFVHGAEMYGQRLSLDTMPFDANKVTTFLISPPAIRVRGPEHMEEILLPPASVTEETLRKRAGERQRQIRDYGFLHMRPINPALCWPASFGRKRATRMLEDLNRGLLQQGITHQFAELQYRSVADLQRGVTHHGYDALLVVLPESSRSVYSTTDTHEQLKRAIEVPSQCIHFDNTLPEAWISRRVRELSDRERQHARRVQNAYALCVDNLLVKHGGMPFVPAEGSFHNVQVGLDVGGVHDTVPMACIGYGFATPNAGLLIRPEEIPVEVQKAEPIPTDSLYAGLLRVFEFTYDQLTALNLPVNFEKTLFYRDGAFLGDGDAWNELSALTRLHAELLRRGWVSASSVWTGAEISKHAAGWRLLRNQQRATNPLIGQGMILGADRALVATTGAPYLRQGTAAPLELHLRRIYGMPVLHEVIRDLVWQADLGLTKADAGSRLPWVLKVADTGALQTARSYHVTGITV